MAAFDDAIESPARRVESVITLGGTLAPLTVLVTAVSVNQAIADLPQSVTSIAGTAAAQATLTLSKETIDQATGELYRALGLSPFSTGPRSTRALPGYGLGIPVTVAERIYHAGGSTTTVLATATITGIELGDDGGASLTCTDWAAAVRGNVTLPAAAGAAATSTTSDSRLNPIAVVDLALRSSGRYMAPPPRTVGALLSVPNIGSGLPDVGDYVSARNQSTYVPSPWPSIGSIQYSATGTHTTAGPVVTNGWLLIEGWILGQRPSSGSTTVWSIANVGSLTSVGVTITSTGSVILSIFGSTFASGLVLADDGAWHYVAVATKLGSSGFTLRLDGTTAVQGSTTPIRFTPGILQVTSLATIGLQLSQPAGTPEPGDWLNGWVPTQPAVLSALPQRLTGIAPSNLPAWQTVQQVAAASGDIVYFDADGVFRYESRASWRARRFGAPVREITGSRILNGSPSWELDSVRTNVTSSVVIPQVVKSTTAAPAWAATDLYTVPAGTTSVFDVDLDYSIYDLKPFEGGLQTDANSSWSFAVRASDVDDPAATRVAGTTTTVKPIAGGLRITIRNGLSFPIAMWTPGNGGSIPAGPYLVVHGKSIRNPDPRVLTVATGATAAEDEDLGSGSPWCQDVVEAQARLDDVAGDLGLPQIGWSTLTLPLDPRRKIGDVLQVQDTQYMDVPHPVQIVGITWDLPADGLHTMTCIIRSAYRPTGFLMDVPGRTSLNTNLLAI